MRSYLSRAFVLALTLLIPAAASAQSTITGVVSDTSGAVLPGVTVEAASDALIEKVRTAVTDGSGQYRIIDLRPGTYTVTFTLPGFNTFIRDGLELPGRLRLDRQRRDARRHARGDGHGHRRESRSSTSRARGGSSS